MLFHVLQLLLGEHARSHIPILNPLIAENGWSEVAVQVHGFEPFHIQLGDLVVALPELFQLVVGHALEHLAQLLSLRQMGGQVAPGQTVRVLPHLLGRGNDDSHGQLHLSVQVGQNLGGVGVWLHLGHHLLNDTLRVDDIGGAHHSHTHLAIELLLLPHAVGLDGLQVGIR